MKDNRLLHILLLLLCAAVAAHFGLAFGALALGLALLGLRESSPHRPRADGKMEDLHTHILRRTFGRYTRLAQYGPLAVLGATAVNARMKQTPGAARLSLLCVGAFLLWGLWLCWLIAKGKRELLGEESGDTGTEEEV